jgi:hypothetical protein
MGGEGMGSTVDDGKIANQRSNEVFWVFPIARCIVVGSALSLRETGPVQIHFLDM